MKQTKNLLIILFISLNLLYQINGLKLKSTKLNKLETENYPRSTYAVLYKNENYKGESTYANRGDYNLQNFGKSFYKNEGYFIDNDISSVKLGFNTDLYIYNDEDFSGKCKKIHNGYTYADYYVNLPNIGMNKMISSYKIREAPDNYKKEVTDCESEYLNTHVKFYKDYQKKSLLSKDFKGDYSKDGNFNIKDIKCFDLGKNANLYLYSEVNFKGKCRLIHNGKDNEDYYTCLRVRSIQLDNQVSSYKIRYAKNDGIQDETYCDSPDGEPYAILTNGNSKYDYTTAEVGDYDQKTYAIGKFLQGGYFINDNILNVIVGPKTDLYIYDGGNFDGVCKKIHNGNTERDYEKNFNTFNLIVNNKVWYFKNHVSSYKVKAANADGKQGVFDC